MSCNSPTCLFQEDVERFLSESLCSDENQWPRWRHWLSNPPLWTVLRVNSHCVSTSEARLRLEAFLQEHGKTHAACSATAVTEHPALDDVLVVASPAASPAPQPTERQVVVGLQCGKAVLRGANVFAPGVLAMDPGVKSGDVVSVFADVDGLCRRGLTKTFEGPLRFVGNGRAEISRYALFHAEAPSGVAITMTHALFSSPPLNGLFPDALFAQNLPSAVACHVLAPQPGETVLDMCAAPGGKTTHIVSRMRNEGVVVALDKSAGRLKQVVENCARLSITCVRTFACDGRRAVASPSAESSSTPAALDSPPFPPESFDRVLVDAPCSAMGQRPQIRCGMSLKELHSFPAYQRQILEKGVQLLRPAGVLVYCTCTLTVEENEGNVAWALEQFPCLTLERQVPHLGQVGFAAGGLCREQADLVQRFVVPAPATDSSCTAADADHDTIGFFIAKFVKKL